MSFFAVLKDREKWGKKGSQVVVNLKKGNFTVVSAYKQSKKKICIAFIHVDCIELNGNCKARLLDADLYKSV